MRQTSAEVKAGSARFFIRVFRRKPPIVFPPYIAAAQIKIISNWKKYRARVSQMHRNRNAPSSVRKSAAADVFLSLIACAHAMHANSICAMNIAVQIW